MIAIRSAALCLFFAASTVAALATPAIRDLTRVRFGGHEFDPLADPGAGNELTAGETPGDAERLALVQFDHLPGAADRRMLEQAGQRVIAAVPPSALLVFGRPSRLLDGRSRSALDGVRYSGTLPPAVKLGPDLSLDEDSVVVVVQAVRTGTHRPGAPPQVSARGRVLSTMDIGPYVNTRIELSGPDLRELLLDREVVAVHRWLEPRLHDERQNQIVAGNHDGSAPAGPGYAAWLATHGLDDISGVLVDVADDGVDAGDPGDAAHNNPDLFGRIAYVKDWTVDRNAVTPSLRGANCEGHGTINAGIIMGDGSVGATTDGAGYLDGGGIAPTARIGGSKIFRCTGSFDLSGTANGLVSLLEFAYQQGARISSNSWGASTFGGYNSDAQAYDFLVRDSDDDSANGLQPMSVVFAAGNDGTANGSVGSPGTAKNVLTVGASENVRVTGTDGCGVADSQASHINDLASFSSRGPTDDGRLKPELVAPGTHIVNCAAQNVHYNGFGVCNKYFPAGQTLYAMSSGTSHSTPAVAGAAALVFHAHLATAGQEPSPALIKASLVASTDDMAGGSDGKNGTLSNRPNDKQGFGRINLERWFDGQALVLSDQQDLFTASDSARIFAGLRVADPGQPVRVVLAWSDAPGVLNSGALINDLDLQVTGGGVTWLGNHMAGGVSVVGGSADRKNNLEAVFLPGSLAEPVAIRVNAVALLGDAIPGNASPVDQDFALVVLNATRDVSEGALSLDRASYGCSQLLRLQLEDADLAGLGTAPVTVASARETTPEVITLVESTGANGVFTADVVLAAGAAVADGKLQANASDTATASYADADDGSGSAAVASVSAAVDCGVPAVTLTAPNGGQALVVGATFPITWTASDNVAVTAVDLAYSVTGSGGPFAAIATGISNSGSFTWTVPAVTAPNAFVRVTARDAAGNSAADASNAAFGIQFPAPVASSLLPASGPTAGGTIVAISGSEFRAGATVRFGNRDSTGGGAQTPLSITPKLVRVTAPVHLGGRFDVSVVNGDGQVTTLADGFTFSTFNDVATSDGFFPYIEAVKWRGVTGGCSLNPPNYCPTAPVTRGQMAVFLVRALGAVPNSSGAPIFSDVLPGDPIYGFVQTFATLGITGGCGGGKFCPNDLVTRGQMAVFLIRALGDVPDVSLPALFADVPPADPFFGYIQRLAKLAITGGCGGVNYCPLSTVTRGQMAVFLTRAFEFENATQEVPPPQRIRR